MTTKKNYLYFGSQKVNPVSNDFEFDESDIWNSTQVVSTEPKKPSSHTPKKFTKKNDHFDDYGKNDHKRGVSSRSLPVNVPDWSKIFGNEYKNRTVNNEDEDDEDENERVPPHEYLARTRVASCSVHEGVGRTLKGRDLRMVRNAIWKQIGFED